MVASAGQIYRYGVDAGDLICHVDHWWLAFAAENGASDLGRDSLLGRSLWDFIADEPTRTLYQELHDRVRSTGNSIHVPFRCDSPTLRRYMQLTISQHEEGKLLYESTLLRTAPQPRMSVLSPSSDRANAFLTMCSCCKRSLLEPQGWLELEEIALRLRLYDQPSVPELRYTLCPNCSDRFRGANASPVSLDDDSNH